jgi:hypothetical protein
MGQRGPPDLQKTGICSWVLASDSVLMTEENGDMGVYKIWDYLD